MISTGDINGLSDALRSISELRLYRYRLPLESRPHFYRGGLILHLKTEEQEVLSEIAPLPGFSSESIETAEEITIAWLAQLHHRLEGEQVTTRDARLPIPHIPIIPSVAFGLETALLALCTPPGELFPNDVLLNALITGTPDTWVDQTDLIMEKGFTTLKIKVGRHDHKAEADQVLKLRAALPDDIKIRLDANRAWDLTTAIIFGRKLDKANIEYIEEPVSSPEELIPFHQATGIPFALDESIDEWIGPGNDQEIELPAGTRALIVKPMLRGQLMDSIRLLNIAAEKSIQGVITSTLESEIGLYHLAGLASRYCPGVACGLGTRRIFAEGLLEDGTIWERSKWPPFSAPRFEDLNSMYLEEIYAW